MFEAKKSARLGTHCVFSHTPRADFDNRVASWSDARMRSTFDVIVLGSGIAGLTYALRMAEHGEVAILTKRERRASNTRRSRSVSFSIAS